MAYEDTRVTRAYRRARFTAMLAATVDIALFKAELTALALAEYPDDVRPLPDGGVIVEWLETLPSSATLAAINGKVASFVGGATTDALLVKEELGLVNATVQDELVTVIDETTPPRSQGVYIASWNCLVAMATTVTNTGVRGVMTWQLLRGEQVIERAYEHSWTRAEPQHFGSSLVFDCIAGDRIRGLLQVAKLGAAAATARMAMARVSVVAK